MHVEIWSDIACPWCAVGKRRFEKALADFEHRDAVTVTWRSFELDPGAPDEYAEDGADHLAHKYGTSREQAVAMQDRMTQVAAGDDLDFRFDRLRGGNTFDAHRLVHLGAAHGLQDAVKERLLAAYLSEGVAIGRADALVPVAVEAGLPEAEVREVLAGDRYAGDVREDERTAARLGITAVPCFVVDRALAASGAQSPEILGELLRQAWAARSPLQVVAGGEACGVDGC